MFGFMEKGEIQLIILPMQISGSNFPQFCRIAFSTNVLEKCVLFNDVFGCSNYIAYLADQCNLSTELRWNILTGEGSTRN